MDVLIVEDEVISRRAIANAMEEGGYTVFTAPNGEEALKVLAKHPQIQLAVVDWEMPVMNGIEFCKAVRGEEVDRYIYTIMVTGRDRPIDTISGLASGADDYVAKPFNPNELLMRIRSGQRIIERGHLQPPPTEPKAEE